MKEEKGEEYVTEAQIARLAGAVPVNYMETFALVHLGSEEGPMRNERREHSDSVYAFSRALLKTWINKNSSVLESKVCICTCVVLVSDICRLCCFNKLLDTRQPEIVLGDGRSTVIITFQGLGVTGALCKSGLYVRL